MTDSRKLLIQRPIHVVVYWTLYSFSGKETKKIHALDKIVLLQIQDVLQSYCLMTYLQSRQACFD